MKLGSALAWGLLLALCTLCPGALAEPASPAASCSGGKPWVELSSQLPPAFARAVLSELGAGLAPSSIEVCPSVAAPETPPLARLSISNVEGETAHYSLNVTDSVTQKRVARDLALGALPPDGRALALAVAAEELLRASWAELALRGVHTAKNAAPPEVRADALEPRKPAALSEPRYFALGGRVAFERFSGKQTHYGADLFAVVPAGSVAALLLEAGVRRALSEASADGSIAATGMSAGVGLGLSVWASHDRGGFDFRLFASAHVLRLRFDPEAKPGSDAEAKSGWVVTTRAGVSLAFGAAGVLRSYTALGAGPVLKSFSASDGGSVVTGASGVEVVASTGVAFELF